jgi:SAM-dependent methyltransferase
VIRLAALLGDLTRARILALLDGEELAVNEIAESLAMSQPRISNHLRLLREAGALHARREGTWTFYRSALADDPRRAELWALLRDSVKDEPHFRADLARRSAVVEQRRRRSRAHFDASAGRQETAHLERDTLREEILAALAPPTWTVVDAGCGDGRLTELLAERFRRVIAVDHSPARLRAARRRVPSGRVEFRRGEVDRLPIEDASCDALFLSLVLHHVPSLGPALREAWRVLRGRGRIVVAELAPHGEEWTRRKLGDLRLGVPADTVVRELELAGFCEARSFPARDRLAVPGRRPLALFLAGAERPAVERIHPSPEAGRPPPA